RSMSVLDPRLMDRGLHLAHFICAADLPNPLAACFTVGWGNSLHLCVGRERWDTLRGHLHARGVMSERLGVVRERESDRRPQIRIRLEYCDICAEWPEPCTIDDKHQAVFDLPANMCSRRNFTWFGNAEQCGYIQRSRTTMEPIAMWELVSAGR